MDGVLAAAVAGVAVAGTAVAGVPVVAAGAVGRVAGGGAEPLISSNGISFNSHSGLGALAADATSIFSVVKQSISTCMFQTPSGRSGKLYTPPGSVIATIFFSPIVAVTVAPGTGRPANFTTPWCSEAASGSPAARAKVK